MSGRPPDPILPVPDEASTPYWEAAREGRLLIQRCARCGTLQFYPRGFCTTCLAPNPEWVTASGNGRVHTFSVVHRTSDPRFAPQLPYVLAIVELDEGVRMTARIVGVEPDAVFCDQPVRVTFERLTDEIALPQFTAIPLTPGPSPMVGEESLVEDVGRDSPFPP